MAERSLEDCRRQVASFCKRSGIYGRLTELRSMEGAPDLVEAAQESAAILARDIEAERDRLWAELLLAQHQRDETHRMSELWISALRTDPAKWSWDALVAMTRLLLDSNYPADLFGTDGLTREDRGSRFTEHLRAALSVLDERGGQGG